MKPQLQPIKRSGSQPQPGGGNRKINDPPGWYGRTPIFEEARKEYNAEKDPYCPFTRSESYARHKEQRDRVQHETKLMSKSQSLSRPAPEIQALLKPMERPMTAPDEKFPKHRVANVSFGETGMTYSAEPIGSAEEGLAELEVLKSILNREGYLERLANSARTVSRKFKPEIADILDLVRAATLDVVEAIVKWRNAKVGRYMNG